MRILYSLVLFISAPAIIFAHIDLEASPIGKKIENFQLRDYRGAEKSLQDFAANKLIVVAFLGAECPVAKLYGPRLNELAKEFEPKGVAFVGINSNQQDSLTAIGHYAKTQHLGLPILKDVGNVVADRFGAQRTPEVFVLDAERVIRYRGRIDDQYGLGFVRPKPINRDLAKALDELLAGKSVTTPTSETSGCYIGRLQKPSKDGSITYSKHIAPILQDRCVTCHRPGEIGPFALTSYNEVAGWTDTIAEVVKEERMPPWHADSKYGKWLNDSHLPAQEKALLLKWIEDGAPKGDPKDLPVPKEFTQGWQIPTPDVVLSLPEAMKIQADGVVPYQYVVVDTGFTEDKWVQAVEIRPTCRPVVHHVLVFVQPPGGAPPQSRGFASRWLAATVPGGKPMVWPEGRAKLIPAGSRLMFQIHYTPTGAPQVDQTCIGMVFADPKTVKQEVSTEMVVNNKFVIPPHAARHKVESTLTLPQETTLLQLMPHTHVRGKTFHYEAIYPDGTREVLLDVPRYDFNWQNSYVMVEPKTVPAGTQLHCIAHFDNSKHNYANPDPNASVRWGEQTFEEMMIGYFDMVVPAQDLQKNPRPPSSGLNRSLPELPAEIKQLAGKALTSREAFDAFATAVHKAHPAVDRLCLTTVTDGNLRVDFAAFPGQFQTRFAEAGFEQNVRVFALSGFALFGRKAMLPDLKKAMGMDMNMMSKVLSSSMHIPIALNGRPGTVNFWSKQADAFQQSTQDWCEALTQAMKQKP